MRAAGSAVATNENTAEAWIAFGGFKSARQSGKEALQHLLFLHADHAVIRPRHPHIRLVSGSVRQNACIGRGHMRVRPQDRRYATIQIPSQSDLLRRCFGMKIHDDYLALYPGQEGVSLAK